MDFTGITLDPGRITVVAGCVLFVIALVRGWIVTGPEARRLEKAREEWRAAALTKDAQLAEKDKQLGHLAEVGKTVEQLARGLQQEMRR